MRLRCPPYVQAFIDRHGRPRYYMRRKGMKKIPLPGLPYTPQFMAAYEAAMASVKPPEIGKGRSGPGTIGAAIAAYYLSQSFTKFRGHTPKWRRAILERFRAEHGSKPMALPREAVIRILADKKPWAAFNWLKTLRGLCKFAKREGLIQIDPTQGIELDHPKSDGIHTWTEEEIEQFCKVFEIGGRQRLAFALLLFTAQRRGDVIRMGRQHIRDGEMSVRQEKTGTRLRLPIHPELRKVLELSPSGHLTFLVTERGEPFSPAGFGNWFRSQCNAAGLPKHCSAHGLRKAACRRLAEAGCSTNQIAAVSGHKSLSEVQRYTKEADQARVARDAMARGR